MSVWPLLVPALACFTRPCPLPATNRFPSPALRQDSTQRPPEVSNRLAGAWLTHIPHRTGVGAAVGAPCRQFLAPRALNSPGALPRAR